jgi:hypothetical protein
VGDCAAALNAKQHQDKALGADSKVVAGKLGQATRVVDGGDDWKGGSFSVSLRHCLYVFRTQVIYRLCSNLH